MTLEGSGQLNGVGQNVDGKAFVSLAYSADKLKSRRFGVMAVTKDGRQLLTGGSWSGNGILAQEFVFDLPLADVAKFIIGTRLIRTVEWKDVILPGIVAPSKLSFGPVMEFDLTDDAYVDFDSNRIVKWTDSPQFPTGRTFNETLGEAFAMALAGKTNSVPSKDSKDDVFKS
jgi:hypothetical protein